MIYRMSCTVPSAKKDATFNYQVLETDNLQNFIHNINKYATCPAKFDKAHRLNDNITEIFGWLRLDLDEEGEAERFEPLLKDYFYIKKPSTNNKKHPYKWHIFIKVGNHSNDTKEFKKQCRQFCYDNNIDIKDSITAYKTGAVQNTNAYNGDIKDAVKLTTVNEGIVPDLINVTDYNVPDDWNRRKLKVGQNRDGEGDILVTLEPTLMLTSKGSEYGQLDTVKFNALVNPDADVRFDCPFDPESHSDGKGENRAYLTDAGRVKCRCGYAGTTTPPDPTATKIDSVIKLIEEATTPKQLRAVTSSEPWTEGEPILLPDSVKNAYQAKEKELGAKRATRKEKLQKMFEYIPETEAEILKDIRCVVKHTAMWIYRPKAGKISVELSMSSIKGYLMKMGVKSTKGYEKVVTGLSVNISGMVEEVDYTIQAGVVFDVIPHPTDHTADDVLAVYTNPLFKDRPMEYDNLIIEDFIDGVWGGKLILLLELIALTVLHGDKKNLIGMIAPPNTGKSEIPQMLGAPLVKMAGLVRAINAEKGLGKNDIKEMRRTGLLLIDEADEPLGDEMKGFVGGLRLDQFGAGGGSTKVPLKCTLLTSIHASMFKRADAEIAARSLCVEVQGTHTIKQSNVYMADPDKYLLQTTSWVRNTTKNFFANGKNLERLLELQNMFEVKVADTELLTNVMEDVEEEIRAMGIKKADIFYVERKKDIEELLATKMAHYGLNNIGAKVDEAMTQIFGKNPKRKKVDGRVSYATNVCELKITNLDNAADEFLV